MIIHKTLLLILLSILVLACKQENTKMHNEKPIKTSSDNESKAETKKAHDPMTTGGLEWTTFKNIDNNETSGSKKYFVDVYTTWCGWCKIMDKKTFTNPEVQSVLKENFHLIKLDAESKEPISFNGVDYKWRDNGKNGINELTLKLLGSRLSYPTLVYLDENMEIMKISHGYKNPEQLLQELQIMTRS